MYVIKRNGAKVPMQPQKIKQKLDALKYGLSPMVDTELIYTHVCKGLPDGISTSKIDALIAEECASAATNHPDYSLLAGRVCANALQSAKTTPKNFTDCIRQLYKSGQVPEQFAMNVGFAAPQLNQMVHPERDYNFDFFGFRTLERAYLLKFDDVILETPQYMYLRVACALHLPNLAKVQETYTMLSMGFFTHATPTLFNAGTVNPQMSSCFLLATKDDSIDGIFETMWDTAKISKFAGGIGLAISNVRAKGSYIKGTGGYSNGIVPMLQVYNNVARYVDQGGNKRKGSFAVYLEPHHPDIMDFLELRKNHGKEEARARDLSYGLWISDLFMERVEQNGVWSLFCPSNTPELQDAYGDDYKHLYEDFERRKLFVRQIPARDIWLAITTSQIETGMPYMLYKDAANRKSNQQNLGTIKSSNLCTEIIEYTSPTEIAVCNLLSFALPKFVTPDGKGFNLQAFRSAVHTGVENLNVIIDKNKYPTPEARKSNLAHRPIGLGVQGLADLLAIMGVPFDSIEARSLNRLIFEGMYFYALEKSCDLARQYGPYSSYTGSPAHKGILQMDFWGVDGDSKNFDWAMLREDIKWHGLRNSLLVAPMPTATTSQILGNNECFEPFTSNMYVRRTLSGEFVVTNKHLVRDLENLGLWDKGMKNKIIAGDGSVQHIQEIPQRIRDIYKTAFEIPQRHIIDMAADRGAFVCQSQSMNIFMAQPTHNKLSSMHFYAWKSGLKTGMYYLRTIAAASPIKFTLDTSTTPPAGTTDSSQACNLDNLDCEMCSG